jgi:hypothetical protein
MCKGVFAIRKPCEGDLAEGNVEAATRSSNVGHLANIATWTGRTLKWDPVKEEFIGDDTANRMPQRAMRAPWTI